MNSTRPRSVAIDARLVGRNATGDSTYWLGLLHGLSRLDSNLTFLLYSNAEPPPWIPQSVNFRWITLLSRNSRWWSLLRFPLAARKSGARAIHTQYNLSPLAGRVGITTIHDVSFFVDPQWFNSKDLFVLRRFVPSSARRATRVITVSETSKSEIEDHIPATRGKIAVTLLARNPQIGPIELDGARKIVDRLGIPRPYLLAVGTRWPRKNMNLAVRAAEGLPHELPHSLVLTGKAGWGEEATGNRIHTTGYVDADVLSALYSAADLYVLPSLHEGFGLTLLEAFACGCPVICSAGGALPEVAGDAAKVMRDWDHAEWSDMIARLLGDPSKLDDLRTKGRARESQFSWLKTAAETVKVYEDVIHSRS